MMDNIRMPDVSGFRLEKAIKLLSSSGVEKVNVRLTASPRLRQAGYNGNSRVVRQSRTADGTVELLVCNSDTYKR